MRKTKAVAKSVSKNNPEQSALALTRHAQEQVLIHQLPHEAEVAVASLQHSQEWKRLAKLS